MLHTQHTAGLLADSCPRCEEMAERPFSDLDRPNLQRIIELALNPDRFTVAASDAELRAAKHVLDALEKMGKLFETHPIACTGYLRERWHVNVAVT